MLVFFNAQHISCLIEFGHAIALRIIDVVTEDGRFCSFSTLATALFNIAVKLCP